MTDDAMAALRSLLPEAILNAPVPTDFDRSKAEALIDSLRDEPLRDGAHLRAIAAARKVVEEAEALLIESIRTSLAAGDSWTMIGLALRTSKQNAHRKYAPALAETRSTEQDAVSEAAGRIMTDVSSLLALLPLTTQRKEVNMPSNNNDRHIVPGQNGGWNVVKPGSDRASSHNQTQADAINRGRDIVRNAGGGELNIHGRDGQIRAKDTIPNGNDPRRSKG